MSFQPISLTIPNRKPFVRCPTFVDGKGPPPHDFYDETQDHLGAFYHSTLGTAWSKQTEDFDSEFYPKGFLGAFSVKTLSGLMLDAASAMRHGEHGLWMGLSGVGSYLFEMATNDSFIGEEDFLFTAKVQNFNRERLERYQQFGFHVSMGGRPNPSLPGFCAGSNSPNWQVYCPRSPLTPPDYIDSGMPMLDQTWYVLQWGRFQGAMRFFINGRLIKIDGQDGLYLPQSFRGCYRYLQTRRSSPGTAGDGFMIDYFHCFIKRGIPAL